MADHVVTHFALIRVSLRILIALTLRRKVVCYDHHVCACIVRPAVYSVCVTYVGIM